MIYIFDADGVVIHPLGFAQALIDRYGIQRETTRPFFQGAFQACLTGEADLKTTLEPFVTEWHWPQGVDDLIEFWMKEDNLPNHEVLSVVDQLRAGGHVCCLASNQEKTRARYISEVMGFGSRFDHLFFSCDLKVLKPQQAYYQSIQSTLKVEPGEIIFFDDSESHIEAAQKAGWNAVLFSSMVDMQPFVENL